MASYTSETATILGENGISASRGKTQN